jgi:general secretion pathway protein J
VRHGLPDSRQRGFTLLEILVAMAIFSIVAYMAYGGFAAVLKQQQIVEQSSARLRAVQFTIRQFDNDFRQLQPRPVREELGEGWRGALIADGSELQEVELTRAGWSNPLGRPRPTLQRVGYRVEDGILIRSYWPVVDRLLEEEPVETELLEGVSEFRIRFLDANGEWAEQWPAQETAAVPRLLPRAVEIVLEREDWGQLIRLIEVAG